MVTCNRCGKPGLHWGFDHTEERHRLVEANSMWHTCEIVATEFDRNGLYEAVDAMSSGELKELRGYAAQRLKELKSK